MTIKLSGNDLTFGKSNVVQSGERLITKSGIREKVLSGSRVTGFHWNGHRFPPPEAGCVLYLPGYPGQGSTIKDFSGEGNDGTISGATWVRGKSGIWTLDYDGVADKTTITGTGTGLNVPTVVSMLTWYRVEGNASAANANAFGRTNLRMYQPVAATPTTLSTYINTDAGATFSAFGSLTLDKWHLLCLVFDKVLASGEHTVYLDGVLGGSVNNDGTLLGLTDDWYIGGGVAGQVNASFALCRIYNRALTALEVANHFNRERHLLGV